MKIINQFVFLTILFQNLGAALQPEDARAVLIQAAMLEDFLVGDEDAAERARIQAEGLRGRRGAVDGTPELDVMDLPEDEAE